MTGEQKEKKEKIDELKYTDLIGAVRGFETNKISAEHLYRVLITTTRVYGAEYVTTLGREMIGRPQSSKFCLRASTPMVAKYCMLFLRKLYQEIKEEKFLYFIAGYLSYSDKRIANEAKRNLEEIGTEEALNLLNWAETD